MHQRIVEVVVLAIKVRALVASPSIKYAQVVIKAILTGTDEMKHLLRLCRRSQ
jgi:hypothetical protein